MITIESPSDLKGPAEKLAKHLDSGNNVNATCLFWGRYQVESLSEQGKFYNVFLFTDRFGKKGASCECWPNIRGKMCTHVLFAIQMEAKLYSKYPTRCIFNEDYLI